MTHQAPSHSRGGLFSVLAVSLLLVASVIAAGQGNSPTQLRGFIDQQVGGIQKLMVPAHNADLPQPRLANGSPDPFFQTTEAKRYLGKILFHDRRSGQDYPGIRWHPRTRRNRVLRNCHLGEAASKSGTRLNFAAGREGGATDEKGKFIVRRRPQPTFHPPQPLSSRASAGRRATYADGHLPDRGPHSRPRGVTALPGRKTPGRRDALLRTGRLDALDSVARQSPGMIGFAFNNRLLLGGFAGEPDSDTGRPQPLRGPGAGELDAVAAGRPPDAGHAVRGQCWRRSQPSETLPRRVSRRGGQADKSSDCPGRET